MLCWMVEPLLISGLVITDNLHAGRICFGNAATVPLIIALKLVDCCFLGSFAIWKEAIGVCSVVVESCCFEQRVLLC
jgi:hypothetical protein